MKNISKIFLTILLIMLGTSVHASGKRTTMVTLESIASYMGLKVHRESIAEPTLHYVGSIGQDRHLLMITKTSIPESGTGMPWDYVLTYYTPARDMTIVNGWDITDKLKAGGFEVYPSNCPELNMIPKKKKYTISEDPVLKKRCLEMGNH